MQKQLLCHNINRTEPKNHKNTSKYIERFDKC